MDKNACEYCNNVGALHYLLREQGKRRAVDYFGRCPKCENWRGAVPDFIPFVDDSFLPICRPDTEFFLPKDEDLAMGKVK